MSILDSDYKTCGKCKHGNFYDSCSVCEDEYERNREAIAELVGVLKLYQDGLCGSTQKVALAAIAKYDIKKEST